MRASGSIRRLGPAQPLIEETAVSLAALHCRGARVGGRSGAVHPLHGADSSQQAHIDLHVDDVQLTVLPLALRLDDGLIRAIIDFVAGMDREAAGAAAPVGDIPSLLRVIAPAPRPTRLHARIRAQAQRAMEARGWVGKLAQRLPGAVVRRPGEAGGGEQSGGGRAASVCLALGDRADGRRTASGRASAATAPSLPPCRRASQQERQWTI